MSFAFALIAALLLAGPSGFAGCGMDPDGCHGGRATVTASSDQGGGVDPDGRTGAAAVSGDQGTGTDPDG